MSEENQDRTSVLIVDDEESIREIVSRKLQSEGYLTETAADGKDALWKAFVQDFDVILMDVKMPGLSGMDVLPKLIMNHPDTCIVMISAMYDVQMAVEAMKMGAYDYLTKPFNLEELIVTIEKALEKRRVNREDREYQLRLEQKIRERTKDNKKVQGGPEEATNGEAEAPTSHSETEEAAAGDVSGDAEEMPGALKGLTRKLGNIIKKSNSPITS